MSGATVHKPGARGQVPQSMNQVPEVRCQVPKVRGCYCVDVLKLAVLQYSSPRLALVRAARRALIPCMGCPLRCRCVGGPILGRVSVALGGWAVSIAQVLKVCWEGHLVRWLCLGFLVHLIWRYP